MLPVEEKKTWAKSLKRIKKDGHAQTRIEKKIRRIREDPDRIGDGKSYKYKGLKSARVNPWVILFEVVRTDQNEPVKVVLWVLKHHNDADYDP